MSTPPPRSVVTCPKCFDPNGVLDGSYGIGVTAVSHRAVGVGKKQYEGT